MALVTGFFLLSLSLLLPITFGAEIYRINNANDFITFSKDSGKGTLFTGTTVLLDSDIDFDGGYSEQLDVIDLFYGTFDGQGHIISNLKMNSTSQFTGIFGNSAGSTLQNVVIDDTCSFVSSCTSSNPSIGSILGYCGSSNRECTIESIVNMGRLSFYTDAYGSSHIGGIVGRINTLSGYKNSIKNCVNYGTLLNSGTLFYSDSMGGIIGTSQGGAGEVVSLLNSLNYGTIIYNSSTTNPSIGGIVGTIGGTIVENCVSSGAVSTSQQSNNIGGIAGYIESDSIITHCLWTSDVGSANTYGPTFSKVDVTNSSLVTLDQGIRDELNRHITTEEKIGNWSKWVLLHLNGGRIYNISQENLVEIQKHFPDPVKEGGIFLFWSKDIEHTEKFDRNKDNISELDDLYATWATNVVTFDLGDGTLVNKSFAFNKTIVYPDIKKEGYTLSWNPNPEFMPARDILITAEWTISTYTVTFDLGDDSVVNQSFAFNESIVYPDIKKEGYALSWNPNLEFMPARDILITAEWTIRTYAVTFDFGNGTTMNESFQFNAAIEYPKNMVREGFTFSGWDNKPSFMPAMDIVIKALWIEAIDSKYVEIILDSNKMKSMEEEEIREVIKVYTKESFTVEKIGSDSRTGDTRVIIKFADSEKAVELIKTVNENKNSDSLIKMARSAFIGEIDLSSEMIALPFASLVMGSFFLF